MKHHTQSEPETVTRIEHDEKKTFRREKKCILLKKFCRCVMYSFGFYHSTCEHSHRTYSITYVLGYRTTERHRNNLFKSQVEKYKSTRFELPYAARQR